MPVFDQLQPAQFVGISFPISECEVRGGLRDHVHEYPHTSGGAPEKMGRKLYEIHMVAPMMATFTKWPSLWPDKLDELQQYFELQQTDTLVIPTVGKIQAYATSWTRKATAKVRSGEILDVTFREDQSDQFLVSSLLQVSIDSLPQTVANLAGALAAFQAPASTGFLDSLMSLINSVLGLADQVQLYGNLLQSKLLAVASMLQEADATIQELNDPVNWGVVDALHQVSDSVNGLLTDLQKIGTNPVSWVVPATMSVAQASVALYGDATQSSSILLMNPIEDAFSIPAGTKLQVYPAGSLPPNS